MTLYSQRFIVCAAKDEYNILQCTQLPCANCTKINLKLVSCPLFIKRLIYDIYRTVNIDLNSIVKIIMEKQLGAG